MFGLSTFRLYAYAAILLVITAGYFRYAYVLHQRDAATKEAKELVTERDQAKADYAAYKADAEAKAKLNKETRDVLQARLHDIESQRDPVRLRCYAVSSVPSAAPQGGPAAGAVGTAQGREPEAAAFDPGPDLEQYGADCAANTAALTTLQEWERARTH